MSESNHDIDRMFEDLGMTASLQRWKEILKSPELGNYSAQQMLREVLTPQYVETLNTRYTTNLKFSKLIDKCAQVENLKTGNGRRYNDTVVRQILTFSFVPDHLNIGIYGKTGAGKSYFMSALCNEACRQNYRCMYLDYSDLLDELLILAQNKDLARYSKKLKYYSRLRILFLDDFAISRYSEDGVKIVYHLLKTRTDLGYPTVFTCQYAPSEWGDKLSDDPECYGKLDGIRRRLTTGYTVEVVKL